MSRLQLVCGPGRIFPWRGRAEVWTLDIYSIFLYRLPLPFVKLMYLVRFFFTSCGESSLRWYIARFAVSILPKAVWKCRALRSVKILSAWTSLNECFRKRTVMTNYERKASADLFHLWKVYMQTMWGGGLFLLSGMSKRNALHLTGKWTPLWYPGVVSEGLLEMILLRARPYKKRKRKKFRSIWF